MIKIGITGQAGFIGTHIYNTLRLFPDKYVRVNFRDEFFQDDEDFDAFVRQCDVIVHLAAVNRHADINLLYEINVNLVQKLIRSMERTGSKPYVIMSSSLQEERDNLYGRSKRDGRELFNNWADKTGANFTGLIIPNVFGPFGVPYYNSVISTFSHQLVIGEEPRIEVDAELKLIYVGDLVRKILSLFPADSADFCADHTDVFNTETTEGNEIPERLIYVQHMAQYKVTELLEKLRGLYLTYVVGGVIPDLSDYFDLCLFNTLRSYLPPEHFPVRYTRHTDPRGDYVEICRSLNTGQNAYSTTMPGITRGNHFHTRKVERFSVIKGRASIKLRKFGRDEVTEYILDGSEPAYVDMPVWYTHNLTNIGNEELVTLFWINEFYDPSDPDTFFEEV